MVKLLSARAGGKGKPKREEPWPYFTAVESSAQVASEQNAKSSKQAEAAARNLLELSRKMKRLLEQ